MNLAIIGDSGCGKSTWLNRLGTGEFTKEHRSNKPGLECELRFATSRGDVIFRCFTYLNASIISDDTDGVIILYDAKSPKGSGRAIFHRDTVRRQHPEIPIVICGNKVDLKGENWTQYLPEIPQYLISAKSNFEFEKPLLDILRQFKEDNSIEFVPSEAVAPPEVIPSPALLARYRKELEDLEKLRQEVY